MRFSPALLLALALALPATAHADLAVQFNDATATNAADLTIRGDGLDDDVTITQTASDYVVSRTGGGIAAPTAPCTGGTSAVTCPIAPSVSIDLAGGNDALTAFNVSHPLLVAGGNGNDRLRGGGADDALAGGAGADTLTGGGGDDSFFGEAGNDVVDARDGVPERIACGAGDDDQARNDFTDILAECERGVDADVDAFASGVDCDDGIAAIHPGALDIFENGIDEDCDGRDAVNLDRDRDGFPLPGDCNDADAAIRPGALEIRGNDVDENCDRKAERFGLLRSLVLGNWQFGRTYTRLRVMDIRNAPKDARIAVSCKGCSVKATKRMTVRRDLAPVHLKPLLGKAMLSKGAVVTVSVTAAGLVGRTYTYKVVRYGELPAMSIVCRAPGAKEGRAC